MARVGFSCRLPVTTSTTGGDGITYQGGFITFPAGTYAEDPTGQINVVYGQGGFATKQAPVLSGVLNYNETPFYDAAARRWVPSAAAYAAPDGASYAYATVGDISALGAVIHIVTVGSGSEKTFHWTIPNVGAPNGVQVMDYDGAGVYLVVTEFEQYPVGVWRMDVSTGTVTALAQAGAVMAVRAGYAWGGAVDPRDPNPPRVPASRSLFDEIGRVNLTTGAQTNWYYTPGRSVFLLGMSTAGWPIVSVSGAPDYPVYGAEVRLVRSPGNGDLVSTGIAIINPETDGDRVWFGSDNGIYLYTPATGLQKVFGITPDPITGKSMSPAGFCR